MEEQVLAQQLATSGSLTPNKSKHFPYILIVCAVVITAVIFGVAGYYFGIHNNAQVVAKTAEPIQTTAVSLPTATISPTIAVILGSYQLENWKTFSSKVYHFSIKYPDFWTYAVRNNYSQVSFDDPKNKDSNGSVLGSVTLEINQVPRKISGIDEAVTLAKNYSISEPQLIKKLQVNNMDVAEVHHKGCPDNSDCITIIFFQGDTLFSLYSNAETDRYVNLPIIYQMISTFRTTN